MFGFCLSEYSCVGYCFTVNLSPGEACIIYDLGSHGYTIRSLWLEHDVIGDVPFLKKNQQDFFYSASTNYMSTDE